MDAKPVVPVEIRHFHLFAGLGGGARGFNRGQARVGNLVARFRCIGGVDVDPAAMCDFHRMAGVPGTVLDLFDRNQYRDFHGCEPPAGWREATPQDIQCAAGGEVPHIVFLSSPCKGLSSLLSEAKSRTAKYVALNRLTVRGIWLMLEAWRDQPPALVVFENVPRLLNRGRSLVDQMTSLLRAFGYACAETVHDCGRLGGLAQSRKRCLIVARHLEQVPPMLYEPAMKPLRAVGEVLGRMLRPGDLRAGPMHRVPSLQWKTWVRLAFVEAGSDWRSLNRLAVEHGLLRDYVLVRTDSHMGAGACHSCASNGIGASDPRFVQSTSWHDGQAYGVRRWDEPTGTVAGQQTPGQGAYAVADPRIEMSFSHDFHVVRLDGDLVPGRNAQGIADPRPQWNRRGNNLVVQRWDEASRTVIAGGKGVQGGWLSVADPRSGLDENRSAYVTAGHYGVTRWNDHTGAVSAAACHDNGSWSVADPRIDPPAPPAADDKLVTRILSEDGTWHRPFTTLELAALQSLFDPDEHWSSDPRDQAEIDRRQAVECRFQLYGESDSAWRERIGNAVPPAAAQAIASEMGRTLLLAWSGETFQLSAAPIWVRPLAMALSVAQSEQRFVERQPCDPSA
jgi:site-specific DNA-cytosine methylase